MENKTCSCGAHTEPQNVPYIVHESAMARSERHIKRLIIALVISIVLLAITNMAWLYAAMQYDFESYVQDGEGVNVIGDENGIDYVAEIKTQDKEEKEWQEHKQGESDSQT